MDYKLYMMKSNRADLELRIRVYDLIKGTPVFTFHGPRQRLNEFEKWVNEKRRYAWHLLVHGEDIYRLASPKVVKKMKFLLERWHEMLIAAEDFHEKFEVKHTVFEEHRQLREKHGPNIHYFDTDAKQEWEQQMKFIDAMISELIAKV